MASRCVLAPDKDGVALPVRECLFGSDYESPACPWRDAENLCRYQADRRDLMKALSLLSTRVFEMSRRNAIPTETVTDICLLLDSARSLLEKSK